MTPEDLCITDYLMDLTKSFLEAQKFFLDRLCTLGVMRQHLLAILAFEDLHLKHLETTAAALEELEFSGAVRLSASGAVSMATLSSVQL